MSKVETLIAEIAEIEAKIAACRRPGRQLGVQQSEFRGYGRAMGLPEVGATLYREDYDGIAHECRVIDNHGAYWSDTTSGQSGRWITVEVPAEYVTRAEAAMQVRLTEIVIDLLPNARRESADAE